MPNPKSVIPKVTILLAGPSASGKSTLCRALCARDARFGVSTSAYLRSFAPKESTPEELFAIGAKLDIEDPGWLRRLVTQFHHTPCVVDSVRSGAQAAEFYSHLDPGQVLRINVTCEDGMASVERHRSRGTNPVPTPYMFGHPHFTWDSSRVSVSAAVNLINQLSGAGMVDVLVGGQYGSEGKGKLAALIAHKYKALVRSGGPNAGHWVRDEGYEFCFHHIPSGSLANRQADVYIAAGATIHPEEFLLEVEKTGVGRRLNIDRNVVLIQPDDAAIEVEMVGSIGSTAQGVGYASARRLMRGRMGDVRLARDDSRFQSFIGTYDISERIARTLANSGDVMLEGTQGSGLSLYHGPYPFTTSRDTNVAGLLSETGVPPQSVRDVWMVCRTFPIRTGGNSGPIHHELDWAKVAQQAEMVEQTIKDQERTSTTNRQRRVGEFDWGQLEQAFRINRPTKIFLSFADYLDPAASKVNDWAKLPDSVRGFVQQLELESGAVVAGVSTGRRQCDVAWKVPP